MLTRTPRPSPRQLHAGAAVRLALGMRALLLALLLVLPLQFSWAATARYCGHESAQQGQAPHKGQHPGHHSHQHRTVQGKATQTSSWVLTRTAASQLPDADCSFCHASVAPYVLTQSPNPVPVRLDQDFVSGHSPPFSTRADHRIDRPNWLHTSRAGVHLG